MNLYRWNSKALKRYGDGDVVVMAEAPDEARGKARGYARAYFEDKFDWLLGDDDEYFGFEAKFREFMAELERDLGKNPSRPPHDVIFVEGSD